MISVFPPIENFKEREKKRKEGKEKEGGNRK